MSGDALFIICREQLFALAEKYRVPAIYTFLEFVEAGGLMSYGSGIAEIYRLVGVYTGRVLKGAEEFSRPSREALGLRLGHVILTRFIERIHAPLAKWVELKRVDKGGREAGFARRYLIYRLAKAAPEIIGKPATVAVTGTFADLCTSVALACGLPETGIAKAIPAVVRELRAGQAKGAGDRFHDCRCFRPKT